MLGHGLPFLVRRTEGGWMDGNVWRRGPEDQGSVRRHNGTPDPKNLNMMYYLSTAFTLLFPSFQLSY